MKRKVSDLERRLVLNRRSELARIRYDTIKYRLDAYRRRHARLKCNLKKDVISDEIRVLLEERDRREEEYSKYHNDDEGKLYMFDNPALEMVVPFLDGYSLQNYALTNSRNFCWGEANTETNVKILNARYMLFKQKMERIESKMVKMKVSKKTKLRRRRSSSKQKKGPLSDELPELLLPMITPWIESKEVISSLRLVNRYWMKAIQLEPLDIVLCHTTASRHGRYEALRSMCRQNLLRVLVRISENSNISSDELEEMLNRVRDVAYEFDCARVGLKPSHKIQNVLEKTSNLEILRLEGNSLGTEGTQSMSPALRFLPKLKRLNLSGNNMGSLGALALSSQLKHVPFLEHLYLYSNNLENTGVIALCSSFSHLKRLVRINLSSNRIGPEGAQALASAIPDLPDLEWLNLMSNSVGLDSIKLLAPFLPMDFSLNSNVESTTANAGRAIRWLRHTKSPRKIWFSGNSAMGGKSIRALAQDLPYVASTLQFLDISNNALGEQGAKYLSESLCKLQHLESFAISQNELGSRGVSMIMKSISSLSSLRCLSLCEEKLDTLGASNLGRGLSSMMNLEELNLFACSMGDVDGIQALSLGMKRCQTLKILKLSFAHILDDGMKIMCSIVFPELTSLVHLELQWNGLTQESATYLSDAMKSKCLTRLETLNLGWNRIGQQGARSLASGLNQMKSLRNLCLDATAIGPSGLQSLTRALSELSNLQTLSLARCALGDEGLLNLTMSGDLGRLAKHLSRLDLRSNLISLDCKKSLEASLRGCVNTLLI